VGISRDCPKFFKYPPIISRMCKAMDFKFGRYIHRVHPNKSSLKFWRKASVGISRDCQNIFVPPIISGTGIATNFKFCTHFNQFNAIDRNKSPLTISGKVAIGVARALRKFSGHRYIACIAQSSLR